MRYAFISDIHGNLEALHRALSLIDEAHIDAIICAGDIVGYGPDPDRCAGLVKSRSLMSVLGNHDLAVNDIDSENLFNKYAREAIQWTRQTLSYENALYLKSLKLTFNQGDFIVFHGSLEKSSPFTYILSDYEAWRSFNNMNGSIGFFGHTHIPGAYIMDEKGDVKFVSGVKGLRFEIQPTKRYLINVGSVGQPRDGNPKGAFTVFDSEEGSIEIRRFSYDIETTYQKIVKAGLPVFLGERLFSGV
ncbi:MAG: metallophosphoesterase family protein [Caldisericaceae bacterium]